MKLLLTGATGFIGSAFLRHAAQCGFSIAGLIRSEGPSPLPAEIESKLTWLRGTLAAPPWSEIERFAPDVCVHSAWIATPGVYLHSPENERYFEWSLALLRRLAEFGLKHVVVLGTCIEYRIDAAPLSEDRTPLGPGTPYAHWKNALRCALENEFSGRDVALAWARVFYPYGIGEPPARLCTSLIRSLVRGEKAVLRTPNSTKDYIYIDDLAEALLTVVQKRFAGPVNLGTGNGITVSRLGQSIARLLGRPELIQLAEPACEDEYPYVVADASRLQSLGWAPKTSLELGLRRLVNHVTS